MERTTSFDIVVSTQPAQPQMIQSYYLNCLNSAVLFHTTLWVVRGFAFLNTNESTPIFLHERTKCWLLYLPTSDDLWLVTSRQRVAPQQPVVKKKTMKQQLENRWNKRKVDTMLTQAVSAVHVSGKSEIVGVNTVALNHLEGCRISSCFLWRQTHQWLGRVLSHSVWFVAVRIHQVGTLTYPEDGAWEDTFTATSFSSVSFGYIKSFKAWPCLTWTVPLQDHRLSRVYAFAFSCLLCRRAFLKNSHNLFSNYSLENVLFFTPFWVASSSIFNQQTAIRVFEKKSYSRIIKSFFSNLRNNHVKHHLHSWLNLFQFAVFFFCLRGFSIYFSARGDEQKVWSADWMVFTAGRLISNPRQS